MKIDFVCIGAQKSGTSWLHFVLAKHPDIATAYPTELDFFTAKWDFGAAWYEAQMKNSGQAKVRGECSPNYFSSRDAPVRAATYNRGMKLIAVLRDPVARAFSNHLHEIRMRHIPDTLSFADGLANNPTYLEQSRYKENLTRWLDAFDRDSLLVLFNEDMHVDPAETYRAACRFIGVSGETLPEGLDERQNESVASRNPAAQAILRRGGSAMRSLGLGGPLKAIKNAPGISTLLAANKRDLRKEIPPMDAATRARLTEEFQQDCAFVRDLTGRADLPWETARSGA